MKTIKHQAAGDFNFCLRKFLTIASFAVLAGSVSADGLKNAGSWTAFNAENTSGLNATGYFGAVYDGRYVYFVPCRNSNFHGIVLRYDTRGSFTDQASWRGYDASNVDSLITRGFANGIYDGRYVYFVPLRDAMNLHARVLRYDTSGDFETAGSWSAYNAGGTPGLTGLGFDSGEFDGRYVYFSPFGSVTNAHGSVLRYDTTGEFKTNTSWSAYDAGNIGGLNTVGYYGTTFDGQYLYLAPYMDGTNYHGRVLRYDTQAVFANPNSWEAFDAGNINGLETIGYKGAVYDGRYVYYVAFRNNTACHANMLRYDTHSSFVEASSWDAYNATNTDGLNTMGYIGAVYDGRYIMYIPYNDTAEEMTSFHGRMVRYDTWLEFTNSAAWNAYDAGMTGGLNTKGYKYGAYDGKHIYFSPYLNNTNFSGKVLRYDTARAIWTNYFSTFLGGSGDERINAVDMDSEGNVYLTGWTDSTDFPTYLPFQGSSGGGKDVFLSKISSYGTLLFSTYLGGAGDDYGMALTLDSSSNIFVTGYTGSTNFPVTNALKSVLDGTNDAFVAKIKNDGSEMIFCTYFGGSGAEAGTAIAVDVAGHPYVAGSTSSPDFPVSNAVDAVFGGTSEAFLFQLSPDGLTLNYSTFLGGSGEEEGLTLAVDAGGSAYVAGWSSSADFPAMVSPPEAYASATNRQVFLAKVLPEGVGLDYSIVLGGYTNDVCRAVALDGSGCIFLAGYTYSSNYPLVNAYDAVFAGERKAFITKLEPDGTSVVYSTFLGGSGIDEAYAVKSDASGHAWVAGFTTSPDFPLEAPIDDIQSMGEAFMVKLKKDGSGLLVSSFFGGGGLDTCSAIALGPGGRLCLAGKTASTNLFIHNPADTTLNLTEGFAVMWGDCNDTDADGMPDDFEERFGFKVDYPGDAAIDADGDGLSNYEEWVADTDPTDPGCRFLISRVAQEPGDIIQFSGSSNRLYSLQACTDLVSGAWTDMPEWTNMQFASGVNIIEFTNKAATVFYRLRVSLP